MLLRSNPFSDGGGLALAQSVGGALAGAMDRFYGHTIPAPLAHEFRPGDFVRLSMPFMSTRSVLLNREGRRFLDESSGYYTIARAVMRQEGGRALLIGDQTLRDADSAGYVANRTLGFELVDRPSEAAKSGANVCQAETLEELADIVGPWGYANVVGAIDDFNRQVGTASMTPPRRRNARPFSPPYFAMEVQPAVTFTFGGIAADAETHVLREDGSVMPGLYAAGADVGGFFAEQYCSGLTMAGVLAIRAVNSIAGPKQPG